MRHQHKIAILKYTKGNFWLLVFPLVRGLGSMKFDFYHWIKGAYMDIIVILFIFGMAYLRWYFIRFEVRENEFYVRKGMLFRSEFALPYTAVSCAACCSPFMFRPLKAVKIFLDSDSHSMSKKRNEADVELVVSETDYLQLYNIYIYFVKF